ncbi:MAG: hypothetical protein EAZ92_06300 [Candidatus Kapaibacterium sp.]|nr:MAG: hypothetical protein EAZ92_06300 [Candidatus Kapabacteria bacterium]
MNLRLITTLVFCVLLLLSNRWLSYEEGITILKAADTHSYMTIAKAAPALPMLTTPETMLPTNHSARFIVPYLAGAIAHGIGVSEHWMFLCFTTFFCGIIVISCYQMFAELGLNDMQYIPLMGLLILNPYTFRYYLTVPAMVNDIVFVAGFALTLLGLMRGAARQGFVIILAGSVIAIAGRQNALVYLPALAAWMLWGEKWRSLSLGKRLGQCAIAAASMIALYVVIGRVIASFSVQGMEGDALTGLVRWAVAPSEGNFAGKLRVFAEYGLRTVIALLFPVFMLLGIAFAQHFNGLSLRNFFAQMPRDFWFALLFVAALYSFAFLGGPTLFMSGVTRYVSHAFPAMLCALAIAMRQYNSFSGIAGSLIIWFIGVVFSSSLHHMTTRFGDPTSDNSSYFAVIYCILAIFAGLLTFLFVRKELKTHSPKLS